VQTISQTIEGQYDIILKYFHQIATSVWLYNFARYLISLGV